jgi:hypothetical protein
MRVHVVVAPMLHHSNGSLLWRNIGFVNDRPASHENLRRHEERVARVIGRIVCGGQSGVDRAAVDFALAHRIPYGGWVPQGGWAEDYPDAPGLLARYLEFRMTPSDHPDVRTTLNVRDSTASLIVRLGTTSSPGTGATLRAVAHFSRPLLEVDALDPLASSRLRAFLTGCPPPTILNVAGPRESESPGVYEATLALLVSDADLFQ